MLTDPKAIDIIRKARQKNVALANRSDRDFVNIFSDFFAERRFTGEVILDLGPGQFDFARRIRDRGGEVHGIDNDPAVVELGAYLGFAVEQADLRSFDAAARAGRYDGLFCKFAVNAFWFDEPQRMVEHVRALDALLKPEGWGWIAPWNGTPKTPPMRDDAVEGRLELQREAFRACGWQDFELSRQRAEQYGMGGSVASHVVFLKNLNAPPPPPAPIAPPGTKRIFVRGISRSGGTLMVTVLDAHPDIAMCYETYEHLLAPKDDDGDPLEHYIQVLKKAKRVVSRRMVLAAIEPPSLRTFTARAERAGVAPERLLELFREHAAAGGRLSTFHQRMQFLERLAMEKARREGKQHWGTKVASAYDGLEEMYPGSYYLFMQRDGRDIAASRKVVGNFNQTIGDIAQSWAKQVEEFRIFAANPLVHARFVDYEHLTSEPETELREIIDFLGLPWDDRVLQFHRQDLSLYRNPTGHLSADQVNRPINRSSVGRWKQELTAEEVAEFNRAAGPLLVELGYESAASVQA